MLHAKELSLSDRLLRYSATASLIASGTSLVAQPVIAMPGITDPEPDIVVTPWSATASIDFNSDTSPEFTLDANSWTSLRTYIYPYPYTTYMTTYRYYTFMRSASMSVINPVAGVQFIGGAKPEALATSVLVSAAATGWGAANRGVLTALNASVKWTSYYSTLSGTSNHTGQWVGKTGSHYLGVMFDIAGNTHYGWVELEAIDAASGSPQLTIKAYGYNPTPDEGIMTGHTPNVVDVTGIQASGGLQTIAASAFAVLGGMLAWIRRKLHR